MYIPDRIRCPPFLGCRYTAPLIQSTHESNRITALSPLHSAKLTDETAVQTVGDEGAERLPVARRRGSSSEGQAERMVELAEMRLRGLAPVAVAELEALVTSATSEQVRLGAARDLVDRSVGKARERVEVAASITVTRPW